MPTKVELVTDTMDFEEVDEGCTFFYEDDEYIKTKLATLENGKVFNAIRDDGSFWYFDMFDKVEC